MTKISGLDPWIVSRRHSTGDALDATVRRPLPIRHPLFTEGPYMTIIDTEAHASYRAFPRESGFTHSPLQRFTWQEHSGDLLVAEMDNAGVDRAWLISYDGTDMRYYMDAAGAVSF